MTAGMISADAVHAKAQANRVEFSVRSAFFSRFGIPDADCDVEASLDVHGIPRLWFWSKGNPVVGLDLTGAVQLRQFMQSGGEWDQEHDMADQIKILQGLVPGGPQNRGSGNRTERRVPIAVTVTDSAGAQATAQVEATITPADAAALHHELLSRIAILEEVMQAFDARPAGPGHNNPPEPIGGVSFGDADRQAIASAVTLLRAQPPTAPASPQVENAVTILGAIGDRLWSGMARAGAYSAKQLDAFVSEVVKSAGREAAGTITVLVGSRYKFDGGFRYRESMARVVAALICLNGPKADILRGEQQICFVPKADIAGLIRSSRRLARGASGGTASPRARAVTRVDDKIEFGWLLDRKISWLCGS
jgi:hypothetical protein